eukprot:981443-Prorocentrum_minimum.AAC.1
MAAPGGGDDTVGRRRLRLRRHLAGDGRQQGRHPRLGGRPHRRRRQHAHLAHLDQSDEVRAGIFSRRTNWAHEVRVYSPLLPPPTKGTKVGRRGSQSVVFDRTGETQAVVSTIPAPYKGKTE